IDVNLSNNISGDVIAGVNGRNYTINVVNGRGSLNVSDILSPGRYDVNVYYVGNNNYNSVNNSTRFVVKYISNILIDSAENGTVYIKLTYDNGKTISNENIIYSINGSNNVITTTDDNGTVFINDLIGKSTIYVSYYGNENCSAAENSTNLLIIPPREKLNTTFDSGNFKEYAVDYNAGEKGNYFNFTLKDSNGNVLANKTVYINIAGKTYNRTTDSNGFARIQINLARASTYNLTLYFLGDDGYNGVFKVNTVTINKKPTTLTITGNSALKVKTTRTLTFTLKGISSKNSKSTVSAQSKKITVTVNGKKYTVTTNKNGKATLKVKFTRVGTYTITAKFAGDNTYSPKTTSVKITVRK
ncbi:MAG: Ig-like domain-containing protein, partial [Methanobrevibacter sp.]